jgi:hypothetical protein
MNKPVIPFRPKLATVSATPLVEERSRMTLSIGGKRYAFEFKTTVTEVNPVDARIVSIRRNPSSQQ